MTTPQRRSEPKPTRQRTSGAPLPPALLAAAALLAPLAVAPGQEPGNRTPRQQGQEQSEREAPAGAGGGGGGGEFQVLPAGAGAAVGGGEHVLRVHEVRDLLQLLRLETPGGAEPEQAQHLLRQAFFGPHERGVPTAGEELVDLLRSFLQPSANENGAELQLVGDHALAAKMSAAQQEHLHHLLELQRVRAADVAQVEISIVTMPADRAAAAGVGDEPRELRTRDEVTAFLRRVKELPGAELLNLQPLRAHPLAQATTGRLESVSYIRDFELRLNVEPNNQTIVDPILDVVQHGVAAAGRLLFLGPDQVGLLVLVGRADLQRPIPTFPTTLAGHRYEIGLPRVTLRRLTSAVRLTQGTTVAIPTPERDGQRMVLLLTLCDVTRDGAPPGGQTPPGGKPVGSDELPRRR